MLPLVVELYRSIRKQGILIYLDYNKIAQDEMTCLLLKNWKTLKNVSIKIII